MEQERNEPLPGAQATEGGSAVSAGPPEPSAATPDEAHGARAASPEAETLSGPPEGNAATQGATEAAAQEAPAVRPLRPGDILDGTVVQVSSDQLLVDVGYKSDGVVPLQEVALRPGRTLEESFQVGQVVPVAVLAVDGRDGRVLLSHRRAVEARAWQRLEQAHRTGEVITAPVVEEVKGGLVVDVGLRGFMPASHVERGFVNDLSVYVGQPVRAKVIEIDRAKNRVILSQKVVLEEEYRKLRERTWADLQEGQIRRGVVKGITDFGAFVDLGGVDGLLHVSEMAWGRVAHPSDVLSVGDEINVKILRLDREKEKISLGLKQVLPDPWTTVEQKYPVGSIVEGKVMRLASFGAFVQLEPGVEGLVHISQLADYHVHDPAEVVQEGQTVRVKVLRVSPAERRISLSIREASSRAPGRDRPWHHSPAPSSGRDTVTLGDMFGNLLSQTKARLEGRERGRHR